jgi:hypothetical protein
VDPPGISTMWIVSEGCSLVDPTESYVAIHLKLSGVWLLKVLRNLAKVHEPHGQQNKGPLTLRGPYDRLLLGMKLPNQSQVVWQKRCSPKVVSPIVHSPRSVNRSGRKVGLADVCHGNSQIRN